MSLRGKGPALVLALSLVIGLIDVGVVVRRSGGADAPVGVDPTLTAPDVEALDAQLARVAAQVEAIRGLSFPTVPSATYLTPQELAARAASFIEEYDVVQADTDSRLLVALGAIPREYDLRGELSALLSEQVAGFYDPETGEMVVGVAAAGELLSPLEQLFLAHELEHALADATLGLPAQAEDPLDADASFAATALVEGDASLTMQDFLEVGLSPVDQIRVAGESLGTLDQIEVLNRVPWVLRRSLEFPYLEGLAFVTRLRGLGGWSAVDDAYADPPNSSAAVLFPERYLARVPVVEPRDIGDLDAAWELRATASFGAADLLFLFEAPGNDPAVALDAPRELAGAWAGGTSKVWVDGDRTAIALSLVDRADDEGLCRSMIGWYQRAFRGQLFPLPGEDGERMAAATATQRAVLRCDGRQVLLGIGPDEATARDAIG